METRSLVFPSRGLNKGLNLFTHCTNHFQQSSTARSHKNADPIERRARWYETEYSATNKPSLNGSERARTPSSYNGTISTELWSFRLVVPEPSVWGGGGVGITSPLGGGEGRGMCCPGLRTSRNALALVAIRAHFPQQGSYTDQMCILSQQSERKSSFSLPFGAY